VVATSARVTSWQAMQMHSRPFQKWLVH